MATREAPSTPRSAQLLREIWSCRNEHDLLLHYVLHRVVELEKLGIIWPPIHRAAPIP